MLNSFFLLAWRTEGTTFWIFLGLFLVCYYYSIVIVDEKPLTSIFMNLLCAGIIYLYSSMPGEVFWFLNIEEVGWLIMLFAFIFTAMLFGIVIGNAWGHLKLAFSIFSDFWLGIIGLIVACVWGYLLIRLGKIIFDEHPILCVLTLLGGLGSSNKSTSYTAPSENSSSGTGVKPGDPYSPEGFPCCNNCKWNQNRGSYFVRCFQNSSREKEPNDKCGQWQRC